MVIDVPPESQVHRQVVRKAASARGPSSMDPATRLYYIEVDEPDMHEPTGDLERVARALKAQWDIPDVSHRPHHPVTALQPVLRKGGWKVTVALHKHARMRSSAPCRALAGPA